MKERRTKDDKNKYRRIAVKKRKTKYWLCKMMNITSRNLNRIIRGDTTSISFKYIEYFCHFLDFTPGELIILIEIEEEILTKQKSIVLA